MAALYAAVCGIGMPDAPTENRLTTARPTVDRVEEDGDFSIVDLHAPTPFTHHPPSSLVMLAETDTHTHTHSYANSHALLSIRASHEIAAR